MFSPAFWWYFNVLFIVSFTLEPFCLHHDAHVHLTIAGSISHICRSMKYCLLMWAGPNRKPDDVTLHHGCDLIICLNNFCKF